jgi:putative methyltransferase (TIGR04325 family)
MASSLNSLAETFFPPKVSGSLAYWYHRWRGDDTVFTGDYRSWHEASASGRGYAHAAILERTRQAVAQARANPGTFERDAMVLPKAEYSFPVLAALLHLAHRNRGRLHVLDFGGSLGSTFFQFRRFLQSIPEIRWIVVEQPHYVACGRAEFAGEGLDFQPTIEAAMGEMEPHVLLLSSVLQYLPEPHAMLRDFLAKGFGQIVLDRTAYHTAAADRLTVQRNPASLYQADYPAWFFNEAGLLAPFAKDYRLVGDFPDAIDRALTNGPRTYYCGHWFEKKDH